MSGIVQRLRSDPEVQELKKKCYELTGEWIPFHFECFIDIDHYKDYMRKIIKEHDATNQK